MLFPRENRQRKRVLVVGSASSLLTKIHPILTRSTFDLYRIPDGRVALQTCQVVEFDLVILLHSLPEIDTSEFIRRLRKALPLALQPQLLVLAEQRLLHEVQVLGDESVFVAAGDHAPEQLERVVSRLLGLVPRVGERLIVQLDARVELGKTSWIVQTENVSEIGMLVKMNPKLPLGTGVRFQFSIKNGDQDCEIRGQALVARHTDEHEEIQGAGLKFIDIEDGGKELLHNYLSGKLIEKRTAQEVARGA